MKRRGEKFCLFRKLGASMGCDRFSRILFLPAGELVNLLIKRGRLEKWAALFF